MIEQDVLRNLNNRRKNQGKLCQELTTKVVGASWFL